MTISLSPNSIVSILEDAVEDHERNCEKCKIGKNVEGNSPKIKYRFLSNQGFGISDYARSLSKMSSSLDNVDGEPWECTNCGSKNPPNQLFCRDCGKYK